MERSNEKRRRRTSLLAKLPKVSTSFSSSKDKTTTPFTFNESKRLRTSLLPRDFFQKIADANKKKDDFELTDTIKAVIKAFGLSSRQLRRLRRRFIRIDIDDSGSIERNELFKALEEKETLVTDAFFKLMDSGEKGKIDFEDFIRVCSTYCIYSRKDILKFCFDCFDADSSGFIDENEYKKMCDTVHNGSPSFPGNFNNALDMFDENDDGVIDLKEFIALDRRFPMLMFPAFRLQEKMQKITLGEKQWTRINERIEVSRYRQDFMNAHNGVEPEKGFIMGSVLPRLNINVPKRQYLCPDDIDKMKGI